VDKLNFKDEEKKILEFLSEEKEDEHSLEFLSEEKGV